MKAIAIGCFVALAGLASLIIFVARWMSYETDTEKLARRLREHCDYER